MNPIYVDAGKLDPNQDAIYNLKLDSKFIVRGCAGSGKTSLALLRMKQLLANETQDGLTPFYYIAFVRELVECMRKEIRQLPDIVTQYDDYAITYENWSRGGITDWIRDQYGITARPAMCKSTIVNAYGCEFTNVDIKINKKPDYLFVDECQDLEIDAIDSFMRSAQKGIGFYGDDDQHIMAWKGRCPVTLQTIHAKYDLPIHDLIFNYRLPKEIAQFAEQLGGRADLSRHCKSPYHERPFMICVKDKGEACAFMTKRISNLGLQDVGVAFFDNEQVRDACNILKTNLGRLKVSGSWNIKPQDPTVKPQRDVHWSHLRDTLIKIMTYEKIKGQQFETVFLFVSGELSAEMIKRFYVGVTRAERFLYILYTNPMPSILRQIPKNLYCTTDEAGNFNGLYDAVTTDSARNVKQDGVFNGIMPIEPNDPRRIDVGF